MEIINTTENELKNLKKLDVSGKESDIYLYNDNGKIVILKKFKGQNKIELENKLDKIKLLSKVKSKDASMPQKIVCLDNHFIGYSTEYYDNAHNLETLEKVLSYQDKIKYLKIIKTIIMKFHKQKIYIGDFNLQNFLLTNETIKLCDTDNFKIGKFEHDVLQIIGWDYLSLNLPEGEPMDRYLFNFMTVSFLTNSSLTALKRYLERNNLSSHEDINNDIRRLTNPRLSFNDGYLIDKLDDEKRISLAA